MVIIPITIVVVITIIIIVIIVIIVVSTLAVQAYGHLREFSHMIHLLRAASSGPGPAKPNLYSYNAAIGALCRVGNLSRALRLEHEMVSSVSTSQTLMHLKFVRPAWRQLIALYVIGWDLV